MSEKRLDIVLGVKGGPEAAAQMQQTSIGINSISAGLKNLKHSDTSEGLKAIGHAFSKRGAFGGLILISMELQHFNEELKQLSESSGTAGEKWEMFAKSLPVVGGFVKAGRDLREIFEGTAEEIKQISEESKRASEHVDFMLKSAKESQVFFGKMAENTEKMVQSLLLLRAPSDMKSLLSAGFADQARQQAINREADTEIQKHDAEVAKERAALVKARNEAQNRASNLPSTVVLGERFTIRGVENYYGPNPEIPIVQGKADALNAQIRALDRDQQLYRDKAEEARGDAIMASAALAKEDERKAQEELDEKARRARRFVGDLIPGQTLPIDIQRIKNLIGQGAGIVGGALTSRRDKDIAEAISDTIEREFHVQDLMTKWEQQPKKIGKAVADEMKRAGVTIVTKPF